MLTYDDWYELTAAAVLDSDLNVATAEDSLTDHAFIRKLYDDGLTPDEAVARIRQHFQLPASLEERGQIYWEQRKWLEYLAYRVGIDPADSMQYSAFASALVAALIFAMSAAGFLVMWLTRGLGEALRQGPPF